MGIAKKGIRTVSTVFKGMNIFGNDRKKAIKKHAAGVGGSANVSQVPAFWYSPELTPESWLLPKSRQEILKWIRIFYNLEPYVRNAIDTHSLFPFSKFDIVTEDDSVTEFYKEMAFNENFDLYSFILKASLSYWKYGEAILFGTKEEVKEGRFKGKKKWKKFILLEPELVEIKQEVFEDNPYFELVPTKEISSIVKSRDPMAEKRKEKLPSEIVEAVKAGKNIPLHPKHVSAIVNATDPSATRGTSIIQSVFKSLILLDKARLAQIAILDRYHFPVELWSVGDLSADPPIMPTDDDLESIKQMINMAIQQPPFSLIFPPILKYEAVGVLGKLLPLKDDYDFILDQLMVGLHMNKGLLLGEGPSFSDVRTLSLQKLIMMYKTVRDEFENWMIYKYFLPIAIENQFFYPGTSKPILPKISWYKSLDVEREKEEKDEYLSMWEKGLISTRTLFAKYPSLDFKTEGKLLEQEKGTIFDQKRLPSEFEPLPEQEETIMRPGIKPEETKPEEAKEEFVVAPKTLGVPEEEE